MPSQSFNDHLLVLLKDAAELQDAHAELRTGARGRQWGLGALNRATVVMCVSAWEAYVEELVRESLELLQPAGNQLGTWPALKAAAFSQLGRFNTPNAQNVRALFQTAVGLPDVTRGWRWQGCEPAKARSSLDWAMKLRHQIAHGVTPRPIVHNKDSSWLTGFFGRLGRCTDNTVRCYLVSELGLAKPW